MKDYLTKQAGFTLIEVLATLAISTIVIGIISSVLITSVKYNNKTQSHVNLRQEANIIITQLREKHQGSTNDYNLCYDELYTKDGITINKLEVNNSSVNENQCKKIIHSKDLPVKFTLKDDHSNEFEIDTVIEGKQISEHSIPIEIIDIGKFYTYLRNDNVFLYSNDITINSGANITGDNATLVVQQSFTAGNSANINIQTKEIYIRGDLDLNKIKLGISDSDIISTIYVDGDVISDKKAQINGHLKYTGSISNELNILGSSEKVDTIIFPNFKLSDLRIKEENWFLKQKYDTKYLSNGKKYFVKNINSVDSDNVIIATNSETIDIKDIDTKMTGILFAPNGEVLIQGGNIEFTGMIIAKKISITASAEVQFKGLTEFPELTASDLPFTWIPSIK